jgi:hypothetical protein
LTSNHVHSPAGPRGAAISGWSSATRLSCEEKNLTHKIGSVSALRSLGHGQLSKRPLA